MALAAGSRVGSYEVLSPLGAGGMGEVYRARDAKLNRDVALKILPEAFAADPDRLARFRREAQVLASLNHPNIGAIYGFEDSGATHALVLEFIDGPTLADRLAHAPMALADALPIARQIANALEAAHEQGIVHRDLKPANIKVRDDGAVKVLDFGLAKALTADAGPGTPDLANSPTLTARATQLGTILGTAAYMAPEQARGRAADKRADIWAFGVVLWEMLTGETLFARETVTETLAAVMRDEPRLDRLPTAAPPAIRRLLARCLERDPKLRLRDIGEARILLAQALEPAAAADRAPAPRRRAALLVVGGIALAAVAGAAAWHLKPATAIPLRRFDLPASIAASSDWALSPDGTRLAYFASGHLYVRALDALDPQDLGPVRVSSGQPFWSPDSRTVAFTSEAEIRSVPAGGGPMFVICRIPASGQIMGATWLANGNIVFSVWRDSLYSVPAAGGMPVVSLAIDPATEIDFHEVTTLPDGRLIVATHERQGDSGTTELFDGKRRAVLTTDPTTVGFDYAAPGVLLFLRTGPNAGLWAVPFTGGPLDLTKATLIQPGATAFGVASDGTLVFALPAPYMASLVWVDRSGTTSSVAGGPIETSARRVPLAVSPDGRHVAFVAGSGPAANLVVRDLDTGADTQLTFNKADDTGRTWSETFAPAWFPQGDRVLVTTGDVEATKLLVHRVDVAGVAQELAKGEQGIISPDGRTLLFAIDDRGQRHLRQAPIGRDGSLGPAQAALRTDPEPDVADFSLSPDGRLIAYTARSTNRKTNVFLAGFLDAAGQWLVAEGGSQPRFSHDGHELFYVKGAVDERGRPKGVFMTAPLTLAPAIRLGAAMPLFDDTKPDGPTLSSYAVSTDGRHFLMWKRVGPDPAQGRRLVVVQNWPALMQLMKMKQ